MTHKPRGRGGELEFTFEVEVFGGEEGKELRREQARAIRNLLLWVRQQRRLRADAEDSGSSASERPT